MDITALTTLAPSIGLADWRAGLPLIRLGAEGLALGLDSALRGSRRAGPASLPLPPAASPQPAQ